jgi:6-pyruvoyltetrahydropterin/6-carboxytetrahydropterin synthase
MNMITATRFHDFSAGHRVAGHENKCALLHGHNYRIHFTCAAPDLDPIGRVIDFGVMKSRLCNWLEENWDHRFLIWEEDDRFWRDVSLYYDEWGILRTPFNPTAENMAEYLLEEIGPQQLEGTGVILIKVIVEETRKCAASASRS